MSAPDPDPWWRDDHLNDGLGPMPEVDDSDTSAPTRAEAAEELRLDRIEWARAEARRENR